jgi:hypothetical protein
VARVKNDKNAVLGKIVLQYFTNVEYQLTFCSSLFFGYKDLLTYRSDETTYKVSISAKLSSDGLFLSDMGSSAEFTNSKSVSGR